MIRSLLVATLLMTSGAALAQDKPAAAASQTDAQAATGQPPQRIRSVTVSGNQACPQSNAEEIVVCSRINPNEQYRIPKQLRNTDPIPAQRQSWVNRAATIDDVSRVAGGLPNTCSPVGTGGQTGCALKDFRDYAAAKKEAERNDAVVP